MLLYQITHPSVGWAATLIAYTADPTGANLPSESNGHSCLIWRGLPTEQVNVGEPMPDLDKEARTACLSAFPKPGYYVHTTKAPVCEQDMKRLLEKAMLLYKIQFDKTAREVGGIVSFNAQHSALWASGGFDGDQYKGVCYGLAMEWLKERAADKEELLAGLKKFRDNSFVAKMCKEGAFVKTVQASQVAQKTTVMAMSLDEHLRWMDSGKSTYPFSDLKKLFPTKRFFYISTGGHAMAAYCNDKGQIAFYDPNVGLVTDTDRQFFSKYFEKTTYGTYEITGDPVNDPAGKVVTVEVYMKR